MSQSPTSYTKVDRDNYLTGWIATYAMVREGASWSGHERNCAYLNLGSGRFANVSTVTGLDYADDGRGVAVTDWDGDGDLDIWVSNRSGPRLRFLKNRYEGPNHFLAVRLVGKSCNRDAIGARVEVRLKGHDPAKLVKTLHAADGYLAQSSKWLHFGLGGNETIDHLLVRWPDGVVQTVSGLRVDGRYEITQGNDQAKRWPARNLLELEPTELRSPSFSENVRIVVAPRFPIPTLKYTSSSGKPTALVGKPGQPLFVNLWAKWCDNCVVELSDLAEHKTELAASGLSIVAVNVDEVSDRAEAVKFFDQLNGSMTLGYARPELLDLLDILQRTVLDRHRALPLPSSFLMDESNRLALIYKGPVTSRQLLSDIKMLRDDPEEIRAQATPFSGRWYAKPPVPSFLALAHAFNQRVQTTAAQEYIDLAQRTAPTDDQLREAQAAGLASAKVNKALALSQQGEHDEAIAALEALLQADSTNAEAHRTLAAILESLGRHDNAVESYRKACSLEPNWADAHAGLGRCLMAIGQATAAEAALRKAAQLKSDANNHFNLCLLLGRRGKHDEAIKHCEKAAALAPDFFEPRGFIALSLLRKGDFHKAVHAYHDALRLNPTHESSLYNLGLACIQTGDLSEARRVIQQLHSINPTRANALSEKLRKSTPR